MNNINYKDALEKIKTLRFIDSKLVGISAQNLINHVEFLNFISGLEEIISQDAETALEYALLNNQRFIKAEQTIIKNYKFAYKYASILLGSRWQEAESNILSSIKYSFLYCKNVICDRWDELENKVISKGSFEDEHLFEKYILKYIDLFYNEKRFYEIEDVLGEKLSGEKLLEYWRYNVPAGKLSDSAHNKLLALGITKPKLAKEYFDSLENQKNKLVSYLKSLNIDNKCTISDLLDYVTKTSVR